MVSRFINLKIERSDLLKAPVVALILANLIPVLGVLFLGWKIFPLMFLFWFENVIIGVINVLKMALSSASDPGKWAAKLLMIPFFCFHYGMFTLAHGIFVFTIFGGNLSEGTSFGGGSSAISDLFGDYQLVIAMLAMAISHGISFRLNYIGKGEYKKSTLSELMGQPYGRVVILHVTIILGGFLMTILGSPAIGLILLVGLKSYIDIAAHLKQHAGAIVSRSE